MDPERLASIERINVVGTSGSGKSTFGRRLAERLRLPFHEIDQMFWQPNWQQTPDDELIAKIQHVTDGPCWVLDGNYTRTNAVKWKQVQLVVWLDMSFTRTLYRVTSRCIRRAIAGTEIWPGSGNYESLLQSFFTRDSIILWSIKTYRQHQRYYPEVMAAPEFAHIWFVRLRTLRECEAFLESAATAGLQNRP